MVHQARPTTIADVLLGVVTDVSTRVVRGGVQGVWDEFWRKR